MMTAPTSGRNITIESSGAEARSIQRAPAMNMK